MTIDRGCEPVALTFTYGQRHARELESARSIVRHYGLGRHIVVDLDIGKYLGSSLTQRSTHIPTGSDPAIDGEQIPSTYVPARNIIFMSVAAAIAESMAADTVVIAANSVDFSGYPDCTPEFMDAYQRMLDVGTRRGVEGEAVRIDAPLLRMSKADIVGEAIRLEVPLELTWSCYAGKERACGVCDSCRLRLKGFREAGASDPIEYEESGQG
jgi:7-cyano-7-deazaguanine synthase